VYNIFWRSNQFSVNYYASSHGKIILEYSLGSVELVFDANVGLQQKPVNYQHYKLPNERVYYRCGTPILNMIGSINMT
jgi:hypothetical protein